MPGFDKIASEEVADAAFFTGLLTPSALLTLIPLPVKVDGLATLAFCIHAEPAGHAGTRILHPVAIIPHRLMLIQDIRENTSSPLTRGTVLPLNVRSAKIYRDALDNPDAFFGRWAETAAAQ